MLAAKHMPVCFAFYVICLITGFHSIASFLFLASLNKTFRFQIIVFIDWALQAFKNKFQTIRTRRQHRNTKQIFWACRNILMWLLAAIQRWKKKKDLCILNFPSWKIFSDQRFYQTLTCRVWRPRIFCAAISVQTIGEWGWPGGRTPLESCLAISAHHSKEEWGLHHHDEVARRRCRTPCPFSLLSLLPDSFGFFRGTGPPPSRSLWIVPTELSF